MKKYLAILLAAVLLPLTISAKDNKPREGVTVMSFNIRNSSEKDGTNSWQYRYPATAMMIDDKGPDIIGLQEASAEQVEYFKTVFDKTYRAIGVGGEDGKKKGEFEAILYNKNTTSPVKSGTFWLSETPDKPSKGWDAEHFRSATWAIFKDKETGGRYLVVNTHIDEDGTEAQKNGVQLIADKLGEINPEGLPVFVIGDFSMEPADAGLAPMKNALSDARSSAAVSDDTLSFNGWGKVKKTIDYIWFKGCSCIKFETVNKAYYERTFISDHFPILATFVL